MFTDYPVSSRAKAGAAVFYEFMKTTLPDIKITSPYITSRDKVSIEYPCGHGKSLIPPSLLRGGGNRVCRLCNNDRKSDSTFRAEVLQISSNLEVVTPYTTAIVPIIIKYKDCGHTHSVTPNKLLSGNCVVCPTCSGTLKHKTPEYFRDEVYRYNSNIEVLGEYTHSKTKLSIKYKDCGHAHSISPDNLLRGKAYKCPTCEGTLNYKTNESFISQLSILSPELEVLSEYITQLSLIDIKYISCGHTHTVLANTLLQGYGRVCPTCGVKGRSKGETELEEFIREHYVGDITIGDRSILGGKELDIVLGDIGVAFEYNGEYWHSEEYKGKSFHVDKTDKVEDFGFQLVHIMESLWLTKKDIVKSRVLSILNKTPNRLFARTLRVMEVPWGTAKIFLEDNHIQGSGSPTKVSIGLVDTSNTLQAIMSFSTPRFSTSEEYELVRFCSKKYTSVVGGASKLLKYFETIYAPKSIISYASRNWSVGKLYSTLGFTLKGTSSPGYYYHRSRQIISRYAAQKHKLKELFPSSYSEDKTEHEIMREEGFARVYDTGNLVFTKAY